MIIDNTATALGSVLTNGTALTTLLGTVPNTGTASIPAIYHMQAPEGAKLPYVVYSHQGGGPDNENRSNLESNLWYVRAYSGSTSANAGTIFTQVDALLHKKNITIGSATTIWCCREENISLIENNPAGIRTYTCGGIYRIRTTNTT